VGQVAKLLHNGRGMAWEKRRNGRLYYYRGHRLPNGRVRKVYVGAGAKGEAAEREDQKKRAETQAHRQHTSEVLEHTKRAVCLLSKLNKQGADLLDAALLSAGFYRHHRGPWRRRRAKKEEAARTGS